MGQPTEAVLFLMISSSKSSFGALARREGVASSTWYISLATSVSDNIMIADSWLQLVAT